MHLRLNMETLSRLLEQDFSSLRSQFHLGRFGDVGKLPKRRDRTFGLADFALLKLAHTLRDRDPRTIGRAWTLAGGFARPLVDEIARNTDGVPRFGVIVRGATGEETAVVCTGEAEVREAVGELALAAGMMAEIAVVNLTALAEEIAVEWAHATGGGTELRKRFVEHADEMSDEERSRMAALISRAQKKLEDGTMVIVLNETMALPGVPAPIPAPEFKPAKVKA